MNKKVKVVAIVVALAFFGLSFALVPATAIAKEKSWKLRGQAAWGRGILQLWGANAHRR